MRHNEYIRIRKNSSGAVLMIHGILGTPRHFDQFLSAIPENWSVYNILLDGHGKTVRDFSHTSMEKWKKQVKDRLWEVCARHKKVVVVGHSLGTLLAIDAVQQYPQVAGLVLLQVPLVIRVKASMSVYSARFALGKTDKKDPVAVAVEQDTSVAPEKYLWRYLQSIPRFLELFVLSGKIRERISLLTIPTYVFQSRQDELVSIKSCRYLQNNPNIQLEILENSGHFQYAQEDVERINRVISALLAEG